MGNRKVNSKTRTTRPRTGFSVSVPVVRGIQAGQDYFTTAVPFAVLGKLIGKTDAQTSDAARSKKISIYISTNLASYVLPAITISVKGELEFESLKDSESQVATGTLSIPIDAKITIQDGLHRYRAIADALQKNVDLATESVPLLIYPEVSGNNRSRRFADIKNKQRKPPRSERIVNDTSDPVAQITREVIECVEAFSDAIEMTKTTISNRSKNLFTFSALYQANQILLAGQTDKTEKQKAVLAIGFWRTVQSAIPDWTSEISRVNLRKQTIHAHGVTLCAIANVGSKFLTRYPKSWKKKIGKLNEIDWSRSNTKLWEGKAMLAGRMTKSAASIELTARAIQERLK